MPASNLSGKGAGRPLNVAALNWGPRAAAKGFKKPLSLNWSVLQLFPAYTGWHAWNYKFQESMEIMDFTKTTPRSVHETFVGIVQLARTTDKAKALTHGTIGEYKYDCPMDKGVFAFLGITGTEYLNVVKNAKNDAEIEAFVKPLASKKTAQEIAAFNKQWMTTPPNGESLAQFNQLRARIAPERTDVKTWPDLLDLEEGRVIPRREPVSV
jgi:hypothetical protein